VIIAEPGLKPSLRFHSVGSTWTPAVFAGIADLERSTRRPIGVLLSAFVKWLFGQGYRQAERSSGSQVEAATAGAAVAPSATGPATAASRVTLIRAGR
jgi:hypothetical protein